MCPQLFSLDEIGELVDVIYLLAEEGVPPALRQPYSRIVRDDGLTLLSENFTFSDEPGGAAADF